ncbi:competence protein ComK [Virgibacillus sp. YIM 98842]|uniref:competence protein ComK n=1 Tax=Virgibacillus sp. YIM 98842 TaxID=2663533 RepID=UPI0013DC05BF|nr:competence protein ComK [Virgibacillus sp. YIM 98842]
MFYDLYDTAPEITPETMAVITQRDRNGNIASQVFEEETDYVVHRSPTKVIEQACKFFGSSLKGRQEGTRDVCGINYKSPIAIDPLSGMYFFPTTSPVNTSCSWIAHSHIEHVRKAGKGTEIIFKNAQQVFLQISYGSIQNQIQRTAQFRYILDHRIRYLKKHAGGVVAEPFA